MKLNQEQKAMLIGMLEHALDQLDMGDMEYAEDINYLIEQANLIKVEE